MTRTHRRRGQNALEFALCLPAFLGIVFATIDFGWVAWNRTSLMSATAVACRAGSTRDPGVDMADVNDVYAYTSDLIETQLARDGLPCDPCTITLDTIGVNPDRSLRCRVAREAPSMTGMIQSLAGGVDLQGVSVTRFEFQR